MVSDDQRKRNADDPTEIGPATRLEAKPSGDELALPLRCGVAWGVRAPWVAIILSGWENLLARACSDRRRVEPGQGTSRSVKGSQSLPAPTSRRSLANQGQLSSQKSLARLRHSWIADNWLGAAP